MIFEQIFDNALRLGEGFVRDEADFRARENFLRTEIARHDDNRVFEVDDAPLAVGQPAVVENLQQHIENIAVSLFNLVKQNHAVGSAANGFCKLSALVIADVSRRRTD